MKQSEDNYIKGAIIKYQLFDNIVTSYILNLFGLN